MKEFKFKIGAKDYTANVEEQANGTLQVTVNGKAYEVELPEQSSSTQSKIVRPSAAAPKASAAPAAAPKPAGKAATVQAPLPGTITKVVAKAGTKVKKGDVLVIMEAMKMANDIVAEADGTVKAICVAEGQSVNQGDALVEFEADAAAEAPKAAPTTPKAEPEAPKAAAPVAAAAAAASVVSAPLPGIINKILVSEGQAVKAGDTILIMEAMKMENNITAETDGTVSKILVQQGSQVQSGDALVELA